MVRSHLVLALLAACASPSHPVPVYEASDEPEPTRRTETVGEEQPAAPRPTPPVAVAQAFLYMVRSPEGDAPPSYLFGTITRGVTFDQAFPAEHLGLIDEARLVYVAVDPNAEVSQEAFARVVALRRGSAADLFPARVWHALTEELRLVTPVEQLRGLRPFMSVIALTQKRAKELFPDVTEVMDVTLLRYARERGRTVHALETPVDELRVIADVPDNQFVALGTMAIDRPETISGYFTNLQQHYLEGDEIRAQQVLDDPEERRAAPALARALQRRTGTWWSTIRRELPGGNVFLALPLRHVLGPQGMIAKLREEGYQVERMP